MYYVPKTLFSIDTNAKTVKGQKYGVKTAVLYLAPARLAFDALGIDGTMCAMSELAQCEGPCLNRAGRGQFDKIQTARINKTVYFLLDRVGFMRHLAFEIGRFVSTARAEGFTPMVRLNGTQDHRWELEPVEIDGVEHPNLMTAFPDVQFYDYTKLLGRQLPSNYHLTFSLSETNQDKAAKAMAQGMNLAVVFDHIPLMWQGKPVISGDEDDLRFLDPSNHVIGLQAKGLAVNSQSIFIQRTTYGKPTSSLVPRITGRRHGSGGKGGGASIPRQRRAHHQSNSLSR